MLPRMSGITAAPTGTRLLMFGAGLGAAGVIALAGAGGAAATPAEDRSAVQAAADAAGGPARSVASGSSADQPTTSPRRAPGRIRPDAARVAAASPVSTGGPAEVRQAARQAALPAAGDARVRRRLAATVSITAPDPVAAPEAGAGSPVPGATEPGRLITIYKGTHFVIPNQWALWVREDSGAASFTADSTYDLRDEDQKDWNKLAGITFTPWRPDRNSMMVVWRYNLIDEVFEVGPFFNVDFRYVFPSPDQIITVRAGETFQFHTDYDGVTVTFGDRTVYKARPEELVPNFWTSARVTGWFGGNEVAPRTVSYRLHLD